jgi:hypothetical protein
MKIVDCNNMNEEFVCNLDRCTCGFTKGKCDDIVCTSYAPIEEWVADITQKDSEIWSADVEGNSREDVIVDGMEYAKSEGYSSFRIGKKIPVGVPTLDIDSILESAYEQVYDQVGECAEGFLDDVTPEQQKELKEQLNDVFFNWIVKHKLEPNCYTIINDEVVEVE